MFTIPAFDKFARKAGISDDRVVEAVDRADRGLIYADLGGNVIKQAIARPNESAKHGFRTILGYRSGTRAFFFYGFAKNEADNITSLALADYRSLAEKLLSIGDEAVDALLDRGEIREIERARPAARGDQN